MSKKITILLDDRQEERLEELARRNYRNENQQAKVCFLRGLDTAELELERDIVAA